MRRRGMGLGGRLLLFSSVLLAIPWLGYRYVGEMKAFLIDGQEQAQLLAVRAVATVLHDRSDLFDPMGHPLDAALEHQALYVYPIDDVIQVDGYASDWGALLERNRRYGPESTLYTRHTSQPAALSFTLIMGERNDTVYGFLRVRDEAIVYRHPGYRRLDNSDHVRLTLVGPDGAPRRIVMLTEGQGSISAYAMQDNWKYPARGAPLSRISGVWQEHGDGYDLEFRFPQAWLGTDQRMLLSVVDVNDRRDRVIDAVLATLPGEQSESLNRLILRSPELERILQGLGRSDSGICVVDRFLRVRAVVHGQGGSLCADTDKISQDLVQDALSGRHSVLQRNAESTANPFILAAHPVYSADQVIGAVLLEKDSTHILGLQRATLIRFALATFLVLLLVVVGLLLFSARLAFRIKRLRREAAQAIDSDGRVISSAIRCEQSAADELGELARGIGDLLGRLQRYTGFLETVPRTLRHEILNPVNTISMSLQTLAQEKRGKACVKNAQQATRQLEFIVNSLTEASHIDGALTGDAPSVFDFSELVSEYVSNSSQLNPLRPLVYRGPTSGLRVCGSDLRIAQLLDKIKDNALDFADADTSVHFELEARDGWLELAISNQGPVIPAPVLETLFVGMTSCRPHTDGKPHLGIGLYIARRIALFHGGDLRVGNRVNPAGVRVILSLPLA